MKSWACGFDGEDYAFEYIVFIHAETRNQARYKFCQLGYDLMPMDYADAKAIRIPELDDKPFTTEGVKDFINLEGSYYHNDCRCEICKGA